MAAPPDTIEGLLRTASAQRQAGQFDLAAKTLRRALRLRPDLPEIHANLGNVHREAGQLEDAAKAYRTALRLRPGMLAASNNLGHTLLAQGQAEEALQLFIQVARQIPDQATAHANVGMACLALGRYAQAAIATRAATRLQPAAAEHWRQLAVAERALGDGAAALACHEAVLRLLPGDPQAEFERALLLRDSAPEEALRGLRRVLAQQPDHAVAARNIAGIHTILDRFEETLDLLDALPVRPEAVAMIETARAHALRNLLRLDEAEAAARRALAADPSYPDAYFALSMLHLLRGEYEQGFALHEYRFAAGNFGRDLPTPRWAGADLHGRTLLLHAEQGFGDTLQFCRFTAACARRGARVVLLVQKPLVRLLRTLEGAAEVEPDDGHVPPHDINLSLMSLPAILRTTRPQIGEAVPYLRADPAQVAAWRARLAGAPGLKLGLCWAGNAAFSQDRARSVRLAQLAPLLGLPGVTFVSLQKDKPAEEADARLLDFTADLADFADTAALVEALDLVITVDSAVAHLAGALAKKTWLLNRLNTEQRWLAQGDVSPWYPTTRIYRQTRRGEWGDVIARVAEAVGKDLLS